jgi:hypothetical protein
MKTSFFSLAAVLKASSISSVHVALALDSAFSTGLVAASEQPVARKNTDIVKHSVFQNMMFSFLAFFQ